MVRLLANECRRSCHRRRRRLGHVSLATTNRYADINLRTKEAALRQCAPPPGVGGPKARAPVWRNDETMLAWLASL